MKTSIYVALATLLLFSVASCRKQSDKVVKDRPSAGTLADSPYAVTLTPLQATAIYQDNEDLQNNCALYQLADAVRNNMSQELMDYIHESIAASEHELGKVLFYDDLFTEFPTLLADVDDYLANDDNGQQYNFDSYDEIKNVLVKGEYTYDPAIYIPRVIWERMSEAFVPSATDYIWAVPLEVNDADINHQDEIFAWEYSTATETPATIALGENAAMAEATTLGVYLTGMAKINPFGYDPDPADEPGPWGSNPWGASGGSASIKRIKIYQRFEGNKWSEVKLSKGTTDWVGNVGMYDYNIAIHVADVHKNDMWTDRWVNTYLTNYIGWNDDRYVIYNLYEYDWYGLKWMLGGKFKNYSWPEVIKGDRKYFDEAYLFKPHDNSQQSGYPFDHAYSVTLYNNSSLTQWGMHGECQWW